MNRKDINVKSESAMKETYMANVPEPTQRKKKRKTTKKEKETITEKKRN